MCPVLSRSRSSSVGIRAITRSPGRSTTTWEAGVAATNVPTPGLVTSKPGLAELLDSLGAGEPVDAPFLLHLVAARDLRPDRQLAANDPVADGARDLQVDLLA